MEELMKMLQNISSESLDYNTHPSTDELLNYRAGRLAEGIPDPDQLIASLESGQQDSTAWTHFSIGVHLRTCQQCAVLMKQLDANEGQDVAKTMSPLSLLGFVKELLSRRWVVVGHSAAFAAVSIFIYFSYQKPVEIFPADPFSTPHSVDSPTWPYWLLIVWGVLIFMHGIGFLLRRRKKEGLK